MNSNPRLSCAIAAILSGSSVGVSYAADTAPTNAADSEGIQEIVVTAQRRTESIQNVPITIQAITGEQLGQLNVTTFDDVLKYLPNVTFSSNGPGQGNIYMRGMSAGFAGNQSSAAIDPFPNVATYLDDQSMAFPARNVDVYMADMERIEVLEGPQGTLFGGGAEAGAIRYITNKPKLNVTEGSADASYGTTAHGDPNTAITAVLNVPLIPDTLAARAVIYNDRRGGYIDNVPSQFTRFPTDPGTISYHIPYPADAATANNYSLAGEGAEPGHLPRHPCLGALADQRRLERADPAELPEHGRGGRRRAVPARVRRRPRSARGRRLRSRRPTTRTSGRTPPGPSTARSAT